MGDYTDRLYGERARRMERETERRVRTLNDETRERAAVGRFVEQVLDRLQLRALTDVTTDDVAGARYSDAPISWAWPTVEALRMVGPLVAAATSRTDTSAATALPTPSPTLVATVQMMEKAEVGSGRPTMGLADAPWTTYGLAVDLALQADEARERVHGWLDAAVAKAIDAALLEALDTAAGSGVSDLAAAVNAVNSYPGPILVVGTVV
jgi:hypothetical protein